MCLRGLFERQAIFEVHGEPAFVEHPGELRESSSVGPATAKEVSHNAPPGLRFLFYRRYVGYVAATPDRLHAAH